MWVYTCEGPVCVGGTARVRGVLLGGVCARGCAVWQRAARALGSCPVSLPGAAETRCGRGPGGGRTEQPRPAPAARVIRPRPGPSGPAPLRSRLARSLAPCPAPQAPAARPHRPPEPRAAACQAAPLPLARPPAAAACMSVLPPAPPRQPRRPQPGTAPAPRMQVSPVGRAPACCCRWPGRGQALLPRLGAAPGWEAGAARGSGEGGAGS